MARQENWKLGIDNRSPTARIAPGAVRDSLNFSPTDAGTFALRPGFESIFAGSRIRLVFPVGRGRALVADDTGLVELDLLSQAARNLAAITPAGPLCAATLAGDTFIASARDMLRYAGGAIRQWLVPEAPDNFAVSLVDGNLLPGLYRLACTFVDAYGDESGVMDPLRISVPAGKALQVDVPAPPAGLSVRLYASVANGETLYLQASEAGMRQVGAVRDDTARCTTVGLCSMPRPDALCVLSDSRLVGIRGKFLYLSRPYRPHLHDPVADFFQFEAVPAVVLPCGAGLFVCAGQGTYFLNGIGTEQPQVPKVLEYGAVSGTGRVLPDGRCAWMSPYGVVVGNPDGSAAPIASERFVPRQAERGAMGLVHSNGSSLLVTTMRGAGEGVSPLAARDYFETEYIEP
ncbi:hypothetical protein [Ectopseudomonas toyotomiensis]|uniref:Uncharacterized protein n=1 Tax=Ectopseudomonas toyotomiensis TaxID=554344 RepID=A0AA42II89_9GAMM|nr:hypothetical protein [Pseudomonas toyotomiensis]MBG0839012.1 hypothetical protein [Pseudomonas toyotomiensis]MDH0699913.1 hypothetical protein [Pseudomonas toyotomiensis]